MVSEFFIFYSLISHATHVLILVVVEYGLGVDNSRRIKSVSAVLILVVVEYGLGEFIILLKIVF